MSRRPVEEGEARIQLQRRLIAELRTDSGSTDLGKELLATLEAMQIRDEVNRAKLETNYFPEPSSLWRRPYAR